MRDDAASIIAGLIRFYGIKLQMLERLLLSETDKLHYGRSGNLEKVIEIIGGDSAVIDDIDGADFEISKAEADLSSLIGVRPGMLYKVLLESGEADELISVRGQALKAMGRLAREHGELEKMLGSASRELGKNIDDLSRICRLMETDAVADDPPRG